MTRITAAALVLAASSLLAAGATIVDWVATRATTNEQEGEAGSTELTESAAPDVVAAQLPAVLLRKAVVKTWIGTA